VEEIAYTLRHGIRYEQDPDTRFAEMPAFGRDEILAPDEIWDVVAYVRSLSGLETGQGSKPAGAQIYNEQCSACHGTNAEGIAELGAPSLADAIWLYGADEETVYESVYNARAGVMPGWADRLDEATIKKLAVYVHSLGGGQ